MMDNRLVKIIEQVPEDIFESVIAEISKIEWDSVVDSRANSDKFTTSRAIHIRTHSPDKDKPIPTTVLEWSVITKCRDHPLNKALYPESGKLAQWMFGQVNGLLMGRIMIVKLSPRGVVKLHIDPLDYFEMYSRFHVPVVTNDRVVFSAGEGTPKEHMLLAHLCQLNNRVPHMLENNSDESRIHIIVDIKVPGGNQLYN